METDSTTLSSDTTLFAGEAWFDPIEAGLRGRIRGFIEDLLEQELAAALGRGRYERRGEEAAPDTSPRTSADGHRSRSLMGSFGAVEIAAPKARLATAEGATSEWRSNPLLRHARRTRQVER
jgi:transposase-like protein